MFNKFDKHRDGTILIEEIGLVTRALGWDTSDSELKQITQEYEKMEGETFINFKDFIQMMSQQVTCMLSVEKCVLR